MKQKSISLAIKSVLGYLVKKMKVIVYLLVAILALTSSIVSAYDPSPLQDFCVAANETNGLFVNGKLCKDPKLVKAEDFYKHTEPVKPNNPLGVALTQVSVEQLPGLNTMGVSLVRIDYAAKGINPPHTHPRATEILYVLEGVIYAGFVTSAEDGNRLFTKTLYKGDVFIFPFGLLHFNMNVGTTPAASLAIFSSQNPGTTNIPDAVFKSNPQLSTDILAKAFQVDNKVIDELRKN
ncbi:unnamed protein product [Sphenostylis stenocarpa]|uniref:Germin-like protein n=1 Tax=Sphenostylis stenocarpa TaxID=92480 RepID=A0AA86RUL8_9FABA|nr:unnamed protein product [Sphenostylis stenocarpa]CAJ1784117.1 unnamed protein product [Sphenostylis stenocarpa]